MDDVTRLLNDAEFVRLAKEVPASGHYRDCQPNDYGCACMEAVFWRADVVLGGFDYGNKVRDRSINDAFLKCHTPRA
jgi:hypothetical protein